MEINYTWNFDPLESYPTSSGQNDVVFRVHWQLYGSTGSYQDFAKGIQQITYNPESTFIPFNELTYETVYNWITASMGEEKINQYKTSISKKIENQEILPISIQQSPWLNT
jgi:hypothetical protein